MINEKYRQKLKKKKEKEGAVRVKHNWKIIIARLYERFQVLLSVESSQVSNAFACVIRTYYVHALFSIKFYVKEILTILLASFNSKKQNTNIPQFFFDTSYNSHIYQINNLLSKKKANTHTNIISFHIIKWSDYRYINEHLKKIHIIFLKHV